VGHVQLGLSQKIHSGCPGRRYKIIYLAKRDNPRSAAEFGFEEMAVTDRMGRDENEKGAEKEYSPCG
jgi:hypothetical protein